MVGAALGLPGSPGPGAGCRLAACEPSVGCAPAPQTRAAVWAEAEQPKPASPGSKARAPAGAPGASLPGCGRGAPPHARCPSLSQSVSSPPPPRRTPAPRIGTTLTTAFGLNHPLKTLISKSAHILRSGELGPRPGDTVQPRRPEEVSSRGQLCRFALRLTSLRPAGSSLRLRGEGGPVRAAGDGESRPGARSDGPRAEPRPALRPWAEKWAEG